MTELSSQNGLRGLKRLFVDLGAPNNGTVLCNSVLILLHRFSYTLSISACVSRALWILEIKLRIANFAVSLDIKILSRIELCWGYRFKAINRVLMIFHPISQCLSTIDCDSNTLSKHVMRNTYVVNNRSAFNTWYRGEIIIINTYATI